MVFHEVMTGTFFYPLEKLLSGFNGTVRIYRENERLSRENSLLSVQNDRLNQLLLQMPRLQGMERFQAEAGLRLKAANVLAEDPGRLRTSWVLDLGTADSLEVNMPVLTSRGIVGKIAKCFGHYSIVQLYLDPAFKVSLQVERSRVRGMLESDGSGRLMGRFPAGSDVRTGDTLITAGLGGVFPKGLKVGLVSGKSVSNEDQTADIMAVFGVNPFQSLNTVEEVFILIKRDEWKLEVIP